jgi:hypothetical protein
MGIALQMSFLLLRIITSYLFQLSKIVIPEVKSQHQMLSASRLGVGASNVIHYQFDDFS